jgi:putative transposase
MIEALRAAIKRLHDPLEVMLTCVRWYVAYPLSLRDIEEMMAERGVFVDHATIHRWALTIVPASVTVFRGRVRPVAKSWRMDETYIRGRGQWTYLHRAVDRDGDTVDFLLTAHRNLAGASRSLECAINRHGETKKITIDKSGANTAAIDSYNAEHEADIEMRQRKNLNDVVEQEHRAIKHVVRPTLGFKSMRCAKVLLAGIETMHMICKGRLDSTKGQVASAANQFYSLAF